MKKKYLIGIDLGGTKLLVGLLDLKCRVLASVKVAMDPLKGEPYFLKILGEAVGDVLKEKKVKSGEIKAAGIGAPGMIDEKKGVVRLSPNIKFLKKYPLRQKLSSLLKVPVVVENDVNAGLYGEHQFGAAEGKDHAVGIFLGTGIGGAMMLDGRLYRGSTGGAGEIGHTFLSLETLSSPERRGTLEMMTGRLALAKEAVYLMLTGQAPHLFRETDLKVRKVKSGVLAQAIKQGDASIEKLVIEKSKILGLAMANVVNLLNPEIIVLGGGLVEAMGNLIIPAAKKTMETYAMKPLVSGVKVAKAQLGDFAIVKGAAKLALDIS